MKMDKSEIRAMFLARYSALFWLNLGDHFDETADIIMEAYEHGLINKEQHKPRIPYGKTQSN